MPHLLTLDGRVLSWPELHAANEAWHAARGPDGYGAVASYEAVPPGVYADQGDIIRWRHGHPGVVRDPD